ncbi:TonB-dependent receptor [Pedobacter sp. MC2016-15]|uniref:TonB-dependent receptor n=1 Tax=Pedobacter sp. MC2016-15 TaxID=2994473 RepID=UPI002246C435|nr:TonB-dependent receptor [Pedobacter sp. MC2016-15]MCX2480757.1 TonB-dependent receptor [Pedobacter sp. MC2016-15]
MKKSLLLLLTLLLTAGFAFAQKPLTGIVKQSNGSPLPSATVKIRGTKIYVIADADGKFSIDPKQDTPFYLQVSSVGFKAQDFQILKIEDTPIDIVLVESALLDEIVVTSRRRTEVLQDVPIPISVIGGKQIEESGAFNVNRVKELVPSVQFYSSNPRNTTLNIRGLGSTFGLTNDGIDPGVGFYVDGVYYARPAAGTLDFIDVERIEVLRGPQGTLFGKNTSSGAISITTRKPSFTPSGSFESSYGNFGYIQAKASITGPLTKKIAGRLSFSGTQRDGLIENIRTLKNTNDLNNLGFRGQLLFQPTEDLSILVAADNSRQRPDGYAQVVAGVVTTQRPSYRQFNAIIADLGYSLPSLNAFDRKIDHDTPWISNNELGGVSVNADLKIGPGTLTSTTAYRYWKWEPSNDRDFTGLQSLAKSNNYSKHHNWSQEVRYAGELSEKLSGVVGLYYINQEVQTDPVAIEESGSATWRFSQSTTSDLWKTPGLFEGFGIRNRFSIKSTSAAAFANLDYEVLPGLHILPGIRYNYDKKDVAFDRQTYGGLQTTDPALLALKNLVYSNQSYVADADENNFTYSVTAAYRPNKRINTFATYSTSFKPIGVNVSGLPTVNGAAATDLAVIKPEDTKHYEFGIKSNPTDNITLNVTFHNSDIKDYQTNVQSPEIGVNRGYLANAEKVRVRGAELDASVRVNEYFSFYGNAAYTDAKYIRFTNAPLPLEETGLTVNGAQVAFKDISGGRLPGVSKWAGSLGGEFAIPARFFGKESKFFTAFDASSRSGFSSSPSPSAFLNVDGYTLLNGRLGYKATTGISAYIWGRNLFDKNYFEQLLPAGGNAGHYAAVLGDQRTYGVTLRYTF